METNRVLQKSWMYFSLFLFFLSTSFVKTTNEKPWICEEAKFTYQLVLHQRGQVQLPITLCTEIELARKQNERVVYKYSDYVSIVIFSKEEIKNLNTDLAEITYDAK